MVYERSTRASRIEVAALALVVACVLLAPAGCEAYSMTAVPAALGYETDPHEIVGRNDAKDGS